MKKAVGYIRVSTAKQEDTESLHSQEQQIKAYCKARDFQLIEIYRDVFSGASANRPALQKLLRDAEAQSFEIVIIRNLSRFGRNTQDLLTNIDFLKSYKIALISLTESIDTETPAGKLLYTVLAAIATFERDRIKEQSLASRLSKAKRKIPTAGSLPFGYRFNPTTSQFEINKEIQQKVIAAAKQYIKGKSALSIAKSFDIQYARLLRAFKHDNIYQIHFKEHDEKYAWELPRLLPDDLKLKVMQRLEANKNRSRGQHIKQRFLLSPYLRCAVCGLSLHGSTQRRKNKKIYRYYKHFEAFRIGFKCNSFNSIYADKIEYAVKQLIFEHTMDETSYNQAIDEALQSDEIRKTLSSRISLNEKQLAKVNQQLKKLVNALLDGTLSRKLLKEKETELMERKQLLENDISEDRTKLEQFPIRESLELSANELQKMFGAYFQSAEHFDKMKYGKWRKLIEHLFQGVDLTGSQRGVYLKKLDSQRFEIHFNARNLAGFINFNMVTLEFDFNNSMIDSNGMDH